MSSVDKNVERLDYKISQVINWNSIAHMGHDALYLNSTKYHHLDAENGSFYDILIIVYGRL